LRERGLDEVLVIGGGIVPGQDVPALTEAGVAGVFGPGTATEAVVDFIRHNAPARAGEGK